MHEFDALTHQTVPRGAGPDVTGGKRTPYKISRAGAALLTVITLSGSVIILGGCNTTAGVGQDVSATGHAVTGAAERTKQAF